MTLTPLAPLACMELLDHKTLLVTGVLTRSSLAFAVARIAQEQGAKVILSSFGRHRRLTEATARHLPAPPPVIELDVTSSGDLCQLAEHMSVHADHLDGVVHSISGGSPGIMSDQFRHAGWYDVSAAIETGAFSLKSVAAACAPMMRHGSSIVGVTFDGSVSWPYHGWMGVTKAAYESVARYLARELGPDGIRVNLVSAAPVLSPSSHGIPGFAESIEHVRAVMQERAPLGWDMDTSEPAARAVVALLSDLFPATTGSIVYVDGGMKSTGA